jgi:hypothetical protein
MSVSHDYCDGRAAHAARRSEGAPVRVGQAGPPAARAITLTRNGGPEAVLVSLDDLGGLEMTPREAPRSSGMSSPPPREPRQGRGQAQYR